MSSSIAAGIPVPLPHSPEELELIVGAAQSIPNFPKMNTAEQQALLQRLQAYECHTQVVKLLEWRIQNTDLGDAQMFSDYLWLMRIHYLGLENLDGYLETVRECTQKLRPPFATIRIHMVEEILGHENFLEQSFLYSQIEDCVVDASQKVLMLERLALIFEKKLFLDSRVEPVYAKINQLDPFNLKALRFYKLWFTQASRWTDVVEQLEKIIIASVNPHEKQRAAHELAQLYLYNLNLPEKARSIIYEHCENSPLDITQTMIEILERLEAYEELLKCLDSVENSLKSDTDRASLKLRQGMACLKARHIDKAISYLRTCVRLNPQFLLGYEGLITALMEGGRHDEILQTLLQLRNVVSQDSSKKQISDFVAKHQQA